jgi:hypothetical protein
MIQRRGSRRNEGETDMTDHHARARELVSKVNATEKAAQLYSVWLKIGEDGSVTFRDTRHGFIGKGTA